MRERKAAPTRKTSAEIQAADRLGEVRGKVLLVRLLVDHLAEILGETRPDERIAVLIWATLDAAEDAWEVIVRAEK